MLPASELDQIRADLETTLPDTCNIVSLTRTGDGMGGWSETWGTAATAVACRMDFIGGGENVMANALIPYSRAILTVPQSTTLTAQHRIEYGGNTYSVQSVNLGSWLGVKRAAVQKV